MPPNPNFAEGQTPPLDEGSSLRPGDNPPPRAPSTQVHLISGDCNSILVLQHFFARLPQSAVTAKLRLVASLMRAAYCSCAELFGYIIYKRFLY